MFHPMQYIVIIPEEDWLINYSLHFRLVYTLVYEHSDYTLLIWGGWRQKKRKKVFSVTANVQKPSETFSAASELAPCDVASTKWRNVYENVNHIFSPPKQDWKIIWRRTMFTIDNHLPSWTIWRRTTFMTDNAPNCDLLDRWVKSINMCVVMMLQLKLILFI